MYLGSLYNRWPSRISLLGPDSLLNLGIPVPQGLVVIGASKSKSHSPLRNLMRQAIVPFSSSRCTRTELPSGVKSA